jgi:hypothetical protein
MTTHRTICLIHGFASAPKYPSEKADALERAFGMPVRQLAYDSSAPFDANLATLQAQLDQPPLFFVGTSLGAFYASRLAEYYPHAVPVMLNPCHNPAVVLQSSAGRHTNFATGETFELSAAAIASYRDIPMIDSRRSLPRWILLNMDDELIDAHQTLALYRDAVEVITFEHGGHRFENIASDEVMAALQRIGNSHAATEAAYE